MDKNTRLYFQNFYYIVLAFLTFLFLVTGYSIYNLNQENPSAEKDELESLAEDTPEISPSIQLGKKLFKNKCASCHAKNMKSKIIGPPLQGVVERWKGDNEKLYAWIRNSQAFLATGDEYANELYLEYKKNPMNAFPELSDSDIAAILDYVDFVSKP